MKLIKIGLLGLVLTLPACKELTPDQLENKKIEEQQRIYADPVVAENSDRITVKRIAVIDDKIAYENRRGIYIIMDNQTGKEYIGVSGIGITESASHTRSSGKTITTVEHEQ